MAHTPVSDASQRKANTVGLVLVLFVCLFVSLVYLYLKKMTLGINITDE